MTQKYCSMAFALLVIGGAMSERVEAQVMNYGGAGCSTCQSSVGGPSNWSSIPGYNTYMGMTMLAPTTYTGYSPYYGYSGCGFGSRCRWGNYGGCGYGGIGFQSCGYGNYGYTGSAGYGSYGYGSSCYSGCGYGGYGCGLSGCGGCGRKLFHLYGGRRTYSCCYRGRNCLMDGGQGWVYPGAMSGGYGYMPSGACGGSWNGCCSVATYGCVPSCCSPVSNCCLGDGVITTPVPGTPKTTLPTPAQPPVPDPNAPTPISPSPSPEPAPPAEPTTT